MKEKALRLRKIELLKRTQENLDARGLDTTLSTMVREFASHFPDLVDNYKLTYPLADDLIQMNPRLHGIHPPKPVPHKLLMAPRDFERVLVIHEFFSTFSDLMKIPKFSI